MLHVTSKKKGKEVYESLFGNKMVESGRGLFK
jgi:hypothetical protein